LELTLRNVYFKIAFRVRFEESSEIIRAMRTNLSLNKTTLYGVFFYFYFFYLITVAGMWFFVWWVSASEKNSEHMTEQPLLCVFTSFKPAANKEQVSSAL